MFAILAKRHDDQDEITRSLRGLAEECIGRGYHRAAYDYFEKILPLVDVPSEKSNCLLRMALVMELSQEYELALDSYLRALQLPQKSKEVWYFVNNNAGYCLNKTGQHQEAERYCRDAIKIDPNRHNAYKNLGIALQNLGRLVEAAQNFMQATKLCPEDARALVHLKDLIAGHPEIFKEVPDLLELLHECHQRVQRNKGGSRAQ